MFVIVILRKGSHLDTFLKGDNLIMIQVRFCIFGQVPPDPTLIKLSNNTSMKPKSFN